MAYADRTKVAVGQTRADIEDALRRHGAEAFGFSQDGQIAAVAFRLAGYTYRFRLTLPEQEQAARSRWRALLLVIRAKLEGVAAGVETIEEAFLAHAVMQGGETVGEWLKPELANAKKLGRLPQRLALEGPRQ